MKSGRRMMRSCILLLILLIPLTGLFAQHRQKQDTSRQFFLIRPDYKNDRYKTFPWIEVPVTAGLFVTNYIGLQELNKKPALEVSQLDSLDPNGIPWYDRGAIRQDADFHTTAHTISDIGMKASFIAPFALAFNDEIREDWASLLLIYLETEAIVGNAYSWGVGRINRPRPLVYNGTYSDGKRTGTGTQNSFYSGHVASTAAATFFMAKIWNDYHPELGKKKLITYGLAAIPPTVVGIYRYKAAKHFPSDIVAGFIVGAGMGILVPELHRRKTKHLSIAPVGGGINGLSLTYRW